MISISIKDQILSFKDKTYSISSAANGLGEEEGSFCTPTGKFKIASMIGDGLESGAVLVARVPTGEIYSPKLKQQLILHLIQVHHQSNTKLPKTKISI